ncbi:FAD-dependent oxidoreductase [Pandoraea oxalativorans]|uniref:Fumarate reductase n=1 Tax=Pandoraea oxalativorans TaxID=573737 RepID=A0A0E3U6F3_9BURK|nr:FAD-dependent oxidoreductase [Pandoraea oxalativorans]AKC69453.1 fumarate reductase [Pandoraea oxalativorans]
MKNDETVVSWRAPKWDQEADFVVVGYGGAGATFAFAAAENGADVLVLEKGEQGGGNSVCVAGGLIMTSVDEAATFDYMNWLCAGQTDASVLRHFVSGLKEIPAFQHKLELPLKPDPKPFAAPGFFPEFPGAPGSDSVKGMSVVAAPGGAGLYNAIAAVAEKHGARVQCKTTVTRLVQNPVTKEVLGVEAISAEGKAIAIKGRKATVIASGGFEADEQMCRQFLTPCPIYFLGSQNLTGDGIRMAQEVGAQLWHMNAVAGPLSWGVKSKRGHVYVTYDLNRIAGFGYNSGAFKDAGSLLWVDKHARRFHNETTDTADVRHGLANRDTWLATTAEVPEFTHVPAFQIFDEKVRAGGAAMTTLNSRTPAWSADNLAELEEGTVIRADTLEELALKCQWPDIPGVARAGHLDPVALKATVERYNANCQAGTDPDFGRENFLVPLDTGPFYAVGPMFPTYLNTHGGPKHDAKQRVLDHRDDPIPRLYAIGECGSLWGPSYNSMGDIAEFIVSGTTAARDAMEQHAWDD